MRHAREQFCEIKLKAHIAGCTPVAYVVLILIDGLVGRVRGNLKQPASASARDPRRHRALCTRPRVVTTDSGTRPIHTQFGRAFA